MITDFFNSTAVVKKETNSTTGIGGVKRSFTTRIASLPCRVSIKHSQEDVIETNEFGKRTVRRIWRLFCEGTETNRAIEETDRITVGSLEYEITGIYNPGLLNRHLQIDLLEVR